MTFISRRDLLKRAAFAAAAVPVLRRPAEAFARQGGPRENLTADESTILDAVVARLIPSDDLGPGAKEAGAVHYIDRALAGALASARHACASGLAALDEDARS